MTRITLPIKPHQKQLEIINSEARYNVIAAGRRFGKTEACKVRAMYRAVKMRVWWITPTYSAGTDTWRDFLHSFQHVQGVEINKSNRRITFPLTGGELRMITAEGFKRGAGVQHMFIDEAAFVPPTLWTYELRPMLLESKGSADFLSSTNGRNWFWEIYQRGLDPEQPQWRSFHYTSYDNPFIDHTELEDIRISTPERVWSQEYMAEWLTDGGAVFRNLTACTLTPDATSENSGRIALGIDWGRHNDYTVIIAIDMHTRRVVDIDRFNEINWQLQRGRVIAMAKKWQPERIVAEANSMGEPNIEALQSEGLPVEGFTTTAASKQQIINSLALAFEQGEIAIPNDPVLLAELQAYTMQRLPSGNFRYTAPEGLHDDCVMALALSYHAAQMPTMMAVFA